MTADAIDAAMTAAMAAAPRANAQQVVVQQQPAYYNSADRYGKTYSRHKGQNGKAHILGFLDFLATIVDPSPGDSIVRTYDYQLSKFKEMFLDPM